MAAKSTKSASASKKVAGPSWKEAKIAPLVLLLGPGKVLAELALARLKDQALRKDPQLEVTRVDAAHYTKGDLALWTSPSLFGESRLILIPQLEELNDDLLADLLAYLPNVAPDVFIFLAHTNVTRGKRFLDAYKAAGLPLYTCNDPKYPNEKLQVLRDYVKMLGRELEPDAASILVNAYANDLRELLAITAQLFADNETFEGPLSAEVVAQYVRGKTAAQDFDVADAVVVGDTPRALRLARHALATGIEHTRVVSAVARKLREMAKVAGGGPEGPGSVAGPGQLGMSDYVVRLTRQNLRYWSEAGLARAILAAAQADFEVKGGARDRDYAIEKMILEIGRAIRTR